jgi:ABC-type polysaccharide/polyol phosphate transport system ATPase subunit
MTTGILLFARFRPSEKFLNLLTMSLKVVNLSKRYNDKWALRDVSFDVADGEVFGIFGPTGAGKIDSAERASRHYFLEWRQRFTRAVKT